MATNIKVRTHAFNKNLSIRIDETPPVLVSDNYLSSWAHSGDGKNVLVTEDRVIIAWIETTPIGDGTPTWVAEYDFTGEELGRWFVCFSNIATPGGKGKPHTPDNHDNPQLVKTDDGTIHMLTGAHHGEIYHIKSMVPGTFSEGWTTPYSYGHDPVEPHWGFSYPAIIQIGNVIHHFARWTGDWYKFRLVYFTYNLDTQERSDLVVIDESPKDHIYGVFYQQPRREGNTLIVDYHPHWRHKEDRATTIPLKPKTWKLELEPDDII